MLTGLEEGDLFLNRENVGDEKKGAEMSNPIVGATFSELSSRFFKEGWNHRDRSIHKESVNAIMTQHGLLHKGFHIS